MTHIFTKDITKELNSLEETIRELENKTLTNP